MIPPEVKQAAKIMIVLVTFVALIICGFVFILLSSDRSSRLECKEVRYNTNLNCFKAFSNYKE